MRIWLFQIAPDVEFTIEGIPPHFADLERMQALMALGVNRISFGAQSLVENIRQRLGVDLTTHEAGGITSLDFELALEMENLAR